MKDDLVWALEDVEHVILRIDVDIDADLDGVRAAAERTDRTLRTRINPSTLNQALADYAAEHDVSFGRAAKATAFVGSTSTDLQAANEADVTYIAYATVPEDSAAITVVSSLDQLASALNARFDARWGVDYQGC